MTESERSLLLGIVVGDGCITKNGVLRVWHSVKQRNYLEYKKNLVSNILGRKININECVTLHYTGKIYKTCGFSISAEFFRKTRNNFYFNGKKHLTKQILSFLTPHALAIWFMDDGSTGCRIHKERGKIEPSSFYFDLATYCNFEEAEIIQSYFAEMWNIYPKIRNASKTNSAVKQYCINFNTKEAKKFYGLIKDHIIPEMQYKLRYCI